MKIAVISDLHVGEGAKSQDLCPSELVQPKNKNRYESKPGNYVADFLSFVKKKRITADYLFVPGDVTNVAHPMEVKLASESLEKIMKGLGVKEDNVIFVPGNHDVDWSMYDKRDKTGMRWSLRYNSFKSKDCIFSRIDDRGICSRSLLDGSYFNLWEFKDLLVLGYNSASSDSPKMNAHTGDILPEHLHAIEKCLAKVAQKKKIRVCMLHHHLRNYPLPKESDRDYSAANNAESLTLLLEKFKFDLILHGHRHHSFLDARLPGIPILCAGSFSAEVASVWEGVAANQFHLIDLSRNRTTGKAHGVICSWSNTIVGWEDSAEKRNSFAVGHKRGFGLSLSECGPANKVKSEIGRLMRKERAFFWERTVVKAVPELAFLSESRGDIMDWCKANVIDARKWEVFLKQDDCDIVFMRKGGTR